MILTQHPSKSPQLETSGESRDSAKAGQRRKCHIIDSFECNRVSQAGHPGQCHRIDPFECNIVVCLGPWFVSPEGWRVSPACGGGRPGFALWLEDQPRRFARLNPPPACFAATSPTRGGGMKAVRNKSSSIYMYKL